MEPRGAGHSESVAGFSNAEGLWQTARHSLKKLRETEEAVGRIISGKENGKDDKAYLETKP